MTRIFGLIQRLEEWLLASSILSIAALTIGNVFSRSVLGESLAFTEELSQFLIVAVTFIGLSYAASRGRHIRMTAISDQLPVRWRKTLTVVSSALTCLLLLALAWYSLEYVATVKFLQSVSPVLQVPLYLVYLVVPLGLLLAAIQYVLAVVKNVTSDKVYLSYEIVDDYESVMPGEV